ncbi:uncharacterized protein [Nicotiana sylvestris]|uniref:uncharacterized protein n=1 Tax=Nicotiana sylvestris TaxID=4096 RepID=UPI00388CA211
MEEQMEENPFADIDEYIEDTNAIVPPVVGAATFKVEHGLILMLKAEGFFRNSTDDDPTQQLRNFLGVCVMHKHNNVSDDALRLRMFKYSLAGDARKWLQNMLPNSILSWPELVRAFLAKWFPQRLATNVNVLTKIFTKSQTKKVNVVEDVQPISNEDFEEANYVNNSQGGYQRQQYQGQGQQNQWRPHPQVQGNQQWRNDQGDSNQGNRNNNNNFSNRSSNPYVPPKGQYSNQGSSSDSKLEIMIEGILKNQENSDTSIRNMTEFVGSHTASIKKLEMQMRDLSREQNPKQKGTLPSDTIANPKGSGSGPTSHIMAITTQSGKVLQGRSEQVVEVEESKHEVEVEEQSVVEVEKFPEELKVQEENWEEVKEKQLSMNIPFVEAFQEMSGFAKYLKDLITKKRTTKNEVVNMTHRVSSIIATSTVEKKEDPGAFTIPCTIGAHDFARALCDNGASINLMPLAIYKQAGLGMPNPISMRLQMADRSIKRPVGIVDDVLVKVGKFHLPTDFVILDCVVEKEIPIILGRPFLDTGRALMDSEWNEIKFSVNDEEVTFQSSKGMKLPLEYESILVIDVVDEVEDAVEMKMEEQCLGEALAAILVNFDGEDMEGYMESNNFLDVLKEHKQDIGWKIMDIQGIPTGICEHKIQLENETKPSVEHQRRLKLSMQKVGGMTVIENGKNELIPTRMVTELRVCMDYRKLNSATCKDHFPMPFIDQILDRLAGRSFYCSLDGYSGYNQINIALEDQEKTTFACPYRTFFL